MVVSSFLSYLLLFVLLVLIGLAGAMIGIRMAKNKNAKQAQSTEQEDTTAQE